MTPSPLTISIVGCGWLGLPLLQSLVAAGHRVRGSARNPATLDAIVAAGGEAFELQLPGNVPQAFLAATEVLIFTLPPGGRSLGEAATEHYLRCLDGFADWLTEGNHDRRMIFCSSTGVYGSATGEIDETAPLAPDTASGRAVMAAEHWLLQRTRPTILRLAGLVGPGRDPGNFYGGRDRLIPQADAPVNLVHQADVIAAIQLLLRAPAPGIYNVCAPTHPPKGTFYTTAAERLGLVVKGTLPGGADGKIISARKLISRGWRPEKIF